MTNIPCDLGKDLLRGARDIAEFLFGTSDEKTRRSVYHLIETSRMPTFRLGSLVCARRSVLLHWIAEQEERGLGKNGNGSCAGRGAGAPAVAPANDDGTGSPEATGNSKETPVANQNSIDGPAGKEQNENIPPSLRKTAD